MRGAVEWPPGTTGAGKQGMGERLNGVKAVITGGAGAIGLATARAFVREGASVFVADLDQGAVDEAVASLAPEAKATGVRVEGGTADVRSPAEVQSLMRDAASRLDGLNALINNAGAVVRSLLVDFSEADIDLVLDVNVKGAILCSQAAVPLIRESGGGSITSTSSQAGRRGWDYSTVYGASKAAVIGLSRAMAVELAPEIRVNSICPGHIRDTGMAWRTFRERKSAAQTVEEFGDEFARDFVPLQRLQTAEDIAAGFVFLTSGEASEITGAALNIGGGVSMD